MIGKVIEGTIVLIVVYLVLANGKNFSSAVGAVSGGYVGAIKAFQGR
jgi:uncharacterized protein YcfJ